MNGHGAGKGDRYRPVDQKKWAENYDRIFGARKPRSSACKPRKPRKPRRKLMKITNKTVVAAVSTALAAVLLCAASVGCSSKDRVANLDATLKALNDNNVAYRGKLTGPTAGKFEMYSGGQLGTGGWVDLEISNSSMTVNPPASQPSE